MVPDKRKLVENRVAVACPVEQQLRARVESDQKILVCVVAGLDELRQRVARSLDLVAAHRAGDVEDHADGNRRIVVAEKGYRCRFVIVDVNALLLNPET